MLTPVARRARRPSPPSVRPSRRPARQLRRLFVPSLVLRHLTCHALLTPSLYPAPGISSATPLLSSPAESAEDVALLAYTLRSHLALPSPSSSYADLLASASSSEDPTLRAIAVLAALTALVPGADAEAVLEQARDLAIELEEAEQGQGASAKAVVGTVFVRAGEWVEAVDVLSSEKESLEWCVLLFRGLAGSVRCLAPPAAAAATAARGCPSPVDPERATDPTPPTLTTDSAAILVQIYLSINRLDMARKVYDAVKAYGDDAHLVQQIEAWLGLRSVRPPPLPSVSPPTPRLR